jgi:membrane protein
MAREEFIKEPLKWYLVREEFLRKQLKWFNTEEQRTKTRNSVKKISTIISWISYAVFFLFLYLPLKSWVINFYNWNPKKGIIYLQLILVIITVIMFLLCTFSEDIEKILSKSSPRKKISTHYNRIENIYVFILRCIFSILIPLQPLIYKVFTGKGVFHLLFNFHVNESDIFLYSMMILIIIRLFVYTLEKPAHYLDIINFNKRELKEFYNNIGVSNCWSLSLLLFIIFKRYYLWENLKKLFEYITSLIYKQKTSEFKQKRLSKVINNIKKEKYLVHKIRVNKDRDCKINASKNMPAERVQTVKI